MLRSRHIDLTVTLLFLSAVAMAPGIGCGSDADDTNSRAAGTGANGGDASSSSTGGAGGGGAAGGSGPTSAVLCDYSDSGDQRLLYTHRQMGMPAPIDEVLPYNFSWTCNEEDRTLAGNGIPNHNVTDGLFATKVATQSINETFPIEPALTGEVTPVRTSGFALNSVKFDPATAGTCPDNAMDDSDCNYAMGQDTWNMVATAGDVSPWQFNFGVDANDAHTQPNGQYHYHGLPTGLINQLNPDHATSMTLLGWAPDGFPIYSEQGHASATDASSDIVQMSSSYQTVATPAPNRPSTADFPLGHFTQDWTYVAGSGDLDECNGRFGVTPEFPDGIYHYHITRTYPFIHRCVRGDAGPGGPPPGP